MQNQNSNQTPQLSHTLNATIITGQYTDKHTQQKKNAYLTIGTLFVYSNGGMSLKLDAYPAHGQNIVFYAPKPKEHTQPNNNQHHNQGNQYNPNQ